MALLSVFVHKEEIEKALAYAKGVKNAKATKIRPAHVTLVKYEYFARSPN